MHILLLTLSGHAKGKDYKIHLEALLKQHHHDHPSSSPCSSSCLTLCQRAKVLFKHNSNRCRASHTVAAACFTAPLTEPMDPTLALQILCALYIHHVMPTHRPSSHISARQEKSSNFQESIFPSIQVCRKLTRYDHCYASSQQIN